MPGLVTFRSPIGDHEDIVVDLDAMIASTLTVRLGNAASATGTVIDARLVEDDEGRAVIVTLDTETTTAAALRILDL